MPKFNVTLYYASYGRIEVDDIEAEDEEQAEKIAQEAAWDMDINYCEHENVSTDVDEV